LYRHHNTVVPVKKERVPKVAVEGAPVKKTGGRKPAAAVPTPVVAPVVVAAETLPAVKPAGKTVVKATAAKIPAPVETPSIHHCGKL
jgi:hypothetical protein